MIKKEKKWFIKNKKKIDEKIWLKKYDKKMIKRNYDKK